MPSIPILLLQRIMFNENRTPFHLELQELASVAVAWSPEEGTALRSRYGIREGARWDIQQQGNLLHISRTIRIMGRNGRHVVAEDIHTIPMYLLQQIFQHQNRDTPHLGWQEPLWLVAAWLQEGPKALLVFPITKHVPHGQRADNGVRY